MLLESQIKKIVDGLGVEIILSDSLDADGHYISAIDTIIINDTLSDWKKRKALLHELGHASKHKKNSYLYNLTFSLHSKMEYEANCYMIEKLLDDYLLKTELDPHEVNYMKFIDDIKLDHCYEPIVKNMLVERICYYQAI